jgi:uncharacterized protein with gpF-like domain
MQSLHSFEKYNRHALEILGHYFVTLYHTSYLYISSAQQWIPGHCQIAGNEQADALAKKGAKITQTHIRETSYQSIKRHLKQVFQNVYRHELETKLSHKLWKQEIAKIPDWPRRKAVAEF